MIFTIYLYMNISHDRHRGAVGIVSFEIQFSWQLLKIAYTFNAAILSANLITCKIENSILLRHGHQILTIIITIIITIIPQKSY